MIKHIVMWNLPEQHRIHDKVKKMRKIKCLLEELKPIIKEIRHIEVGINITNNEFSKDIVLYSEFENEQDLASYLKNPEHIKVSKLISNLQKDKKVVDYYV